MIARVFVYWAVPLILISGGYLALGGLWILLGTILLGRYVDRHPA